MAPRESKDDPTLQLEGRDASQRLVAVWSGGSIARDLPKTGTLTIGRAADADLSIDHSSVSRRHANLVLGAAIRIEDLKSSNGTWVNGKRLLPGASATLSVDALIEIGTVLIVIRSGAQHVPEARPALGKEPSVVVCDTEMQRVHELVDIVAKSNLSVILLGETGVGKELLASRVHSGSPRAEKPFLKVNCAALVESLLEAELFGYERGAFTGAVQAKVGLLEGASGGTLFLDEVGELPASIQAKLLRVLESGEVTRIGSLAPRTIDVRFVAATNRHLRQLVDAGRFRQDLYFRLDGISVGIPPLRERPSEVPELARAFADEAALSQGKAPVSISPQAAEHLLRHSWPGNVRELRNVIARSVLLCKGDTLQVSDLRFDTLGGPAASVPPRAVPAGAQKDGDERQRIIDALEQSAGNQTRAARLLGISRRTLLHRLDAFDLPRPRPRK